MSTVVDEGLKIQASDVTGQKLADAIGIPSDATIGELVQGLLAQMNLPRNSADGHPLTYHARLDREGRHLNSAETVGDALQTGDKLVLQPHIVAGGEG